MMIIDHIIYYNLYSLYIYKYIYFVSNLAYVNIYMRNLLFMIYYKYTCLYVFMYKIRFSPDVNILYSNINIYINTINYNE